MDDMATKIVKEYEKLMGNTVKEWPTPGYPSMKLTKPEDDSEIVDEKNYRSMVGKSMYFVNKVCPVCLSITKELAKFFACPTKMHWRIYQRKYRQGSAIEETEGIENCCLHGFRLCKCSGMEE